MKIYFSSRDIPKLQAQPLKARLAAVEKATKKLTPPEKTLLNVLKLLVIVPVFAMILRSAQDWTSLLWAAVFIVLYPLVLKPIQHHMVQKYL